MTSTVSGNLLTLDDDPIFRPDQIPDVPKASYLYAKGGEKTFELDKKCKFADGKPIIIHEREAVKGEILRDVNFRYRLDVSENLAYRMKVKTMAERSAEIQQVQMDMCRSSILYFANVWAWTFVPGEEAVPFILYDFQEDLLTWMVWLTKMETPGLVEKSRCQGLSWLSRLISGWTCLFFNNKVCYDLSLGKTEVDDRTMDSLFGKMRYLFKYLPNWMTGGWTEYGLGVDNIMKMNIPKTKGLLKGLLTGSTAGRSGRGILGIYDEFAHVESAQETLEAGSSLATCEIYISTVKGMDNPFAVMAHNESTVKKTIHWKQNPTLNNEWSIKERAKPKYINQELWDQEMEIQYETSTSGRVFPQMVSFSHNPLEWCHLVSGPAWEYDENYTVQIGMDYGLSDPNTVVYGQVKPTVAGFNNKYGMCLVFVDEDSNTEQGFDDTVIGGQVTETGLVSMVKEKGYRYEVCAGDLYTADKRDNITKKKYLDFFRENGLYVVGKRNSIVAPIEALQGMFETPGAIAINKEKCPGLVVALQNWAFPTDKEGLRIPGSQPQPRSQHSHYCKAICYLVDYLHGKPVGKKKKGKLNWAFNHVKRALL